jgi:hypothetical protein
MKPYSYSGGSHNNMNEVFKWAESKKGGDGVRRRKTRRASATARSARRMTNRRARETGKKEREG